jgi:PhnB protein
MNFEDDYPTVSASLAVKNAAEAIAFYEKAFGAQERYRLIDPESGKIGHAELRVGDSVLMLADEYPGFNRTPDSLGGSPVGLSLMVADVDQTVERAVAAGATVTRAAENQFYGYRCANVRDPFGHHWMLSQKLEEVTPEEMQKRWNEMAKKKS